MLFVVGELELSIALHIDADIEGLLPLTMQADMKDVTTVNIMSKMQSLQLKVNSVIALVPKNMSCLAAERNKEARSFLALEALPITKNSPPRYPTRLAGIFVEILCASKIDMVKELNIRSWASSLALCYISKP
ncbi:hypothetical protein AgCh_003866 [Apium graveolens]